MKIKFVVPPENVPMKGRPEYKVGQVVEFNGPIAETYARKYVDRGWAVEDKGRADRVVDDPPAGGPVDSVGRPVQIQVQVPAAAAATAQTK